jgi:hypothetical protein
MVHGPKIAVSLLGSEMEMKSCHYLIPYPLFSLYTVKKYVGFIFLLIKGNTVYSVSERMQYIGN